MKRIIGLALIAGMMLYGTWALAVDAVTNTKHDLSSTSTAYALKGAGQLASSNEGQMCIFCHTPHRAHATFKPLWNHNADAGAFTMYNATWSTTINQAVDAQPGSVSAACLACHDGAIGMNSIINDSGVVPDGNAMITGNANMGKVLTNDHPISIAYPAVGNTELKDVTGLTTVQIFNGKVECASCHKVHDNTLSPFLRSTNVGSALCKVCHIK